MYSFNDYFIDLKIVEVEFDQNPIISFLFSSYASPYSVIFDLNSNEFIFIFFYVSTINEFK